MPHDIVSIIGGGWGARRSNLAKIPGTIVCVNDAAMHAPRCDIIVSMDRLWMENRWTALEHMQIKTYARTAACRGALADPPSWLHPFECKNEESEFGQDTDHLNGPNSGHCALNLAFLMKPVRIDLIGFDMRRGPKNEAYWYPSYSWARVGGGTSNTRYAEWAAMFEHGLRQCSDAGIEVVRH